MGQESMNSRMMRIGRNELTFDRVIPIEEIMERVNGVTLDAVAAIADQIFSNEMFAMATVGPTVKKKRAKKSVA